MELEHLVVVLQKENKCKIRENLKSASVYATLKSQIEWLRPGSVLCVQGDGMTFL